MRLYAAIVLRRPYVRWFASILRRVFLRFMRDNTISSASAKYLYDLGVGVKISRWLFYLIVFLVPIGTKKFVYSFPLPFAVPILYSAIFFSVLDVPILLFVFLNIKRVALSAASRFLFLFLVAALASLFFAPSIGLSLYTLSRLTLFSLFALIAASLLKEGSVDLTKTFGVLGASALAQSVIALLQFRNQGSIGLKILGESVLGPLTQGVARVSTEFGSFLRVYGTMPHANILAAFLVFGFLGLGYFFLKSNAQSTVRRCVVAGALFVIFSALILTFSRSGIITFGLSIVAIIIYAFLSAKPLQKRIAAFIAVLIVFFVFSATVFGKLSTARDTISSSEPSVTYRINYGLIALNLVRSQPFFGVGVGNQILAGLDARLYQNEGLKTGWQWQPVHNVYLLVASETGLVGFAFFLLFLWEVFWPAAKEFWIEKKNERGLDVFFPLIIGFLWLLFGLVDHFFWDLEQGQLIFWLTIGIIMGVSAIQREEAS